MEEAELWRGCELDVTELKGRDEARKDENSANTGRSFHRSAVPSQALSQQASTQTRTLGNKKTKKINIKPKNYLKRHAINSSRRNDCY